MPQLHYSIAKGELTVSAIVGVGEQDGLALMEAGRSMPPPIHVSALIDTGCSITAVTPSVLRRLGLASVSAGSSQTASGSVAEDLYRISLSVFDASRGHMLTRPDMLVSELATIIPNLDVLIGMDVLLDCKLTLDGPARQFTLEF